MVDHAEELWQVSNQKLIEKQQKLIKQQQKLIKQQQKDIKKQQTAIPQTQVKAENFNKVMVMFSGLGL